MKHRFLTLLVLTASLEGAPAASPPATVTKEGDLTTVVLKPEAEQRLRLKTVPIAQRRVPGSRLFAGEVVRGLAGDGGAMAPLVGGTLEEVLRLADQQAGADGRVQAARVQVDAARVALERARKVLAAEAGSVRTVDEAQAALALAEATLATAQEQRRLLGAPVSASANAGGLWIRAAIFSGETAQLDPQSVAAVRALAAGAPAQTARPVRGPVTAQAATATVDWYYELQANPGLRPGERVAVEISLLAAKNESRVVPVQAVLHDIHGGQWVYEAVGPHTFARRRVQVARVAGGEAVLASGPAVGAAIVTDGAAELFGTEFMTGK